MVWTRSKVGKPEAVPRRAKYWIDVISIDYFYSIIIFTVEAQREIIRKRRDLCFAGGREEREKFAKQLGILRCSLPGWLAPTSGRAVLALSACMCVCVSARKGDGGSYTREVVT